MGEIKILNTDRKKILEFLRDLYPERVKKDEILKGTEIREPTLSKELSYLVEKKFVRKIDQNDPFLDLFIKSKYRITADGIDQIYSQLVSEKDLESRPISSEEKKEYSSAPTINEVESTDSIQEVQRVAKESIDLIKAYRSEMTQFKEETQERINRFEREFFVRIVEIFGVFVAIFSFLVLTFNITAKIDMTRSFTELLTFSLGLYIPVVLLILILLGAIWLITR